MVVGDGGGGGGDGTCGVGPGWVTLNQSRTNGVFFLGILRILNATGGTQYENKQEKQTSHSDTLAY